MNRLQKKCVIGTVGIHLLLFLILIVGPAFFNPQPKLDNSQVLDMIPANLVDAAVNSGVQNAQPPPPTPTPVATPQPPQPQAIPLPPRIVQPPAPTPPPTPSPSLLKEFEKYLMSKPTPAVKPDLTPVEHQTKSQQNNIKVDLTKVKRSPQKNVPRTDNNTKAINNALKSLSKNLSSATKIDLSGSSSVAYANYGQVVLSMYNNAWQPPQGMVSDNVHVVFKVRIARDGTVISAQIVSSSGDPSVDSAVQRMLDRVTFIAPFPEGTDDKERAYPIDFTATRTTE